MQLGIFAKTFPGHDPLVVLTAAREAGFGSVQYNMACSGLDALPGNIPEHVAQKVLAAVQQSGVSIIALSGTCNLIHPDLAMRDNGLSRLEALIEAAARMAIPLVTLCTGTRDAADPWRHHPDNATPEAWRDLHHALDRIAPLAERHGIALGVEPEHGNVVRDAAAAKRLLSERADPRLRIVFDAANLLEGVPLPAHPRVIQQAIDDLAAHIAIAHAKDRAADGSVRPAGGGIVDFPFLLGALNRAGFDGPLITHGLTAVEAPGAAQHLRAAALAAGVILV